MAAVPYVDPVEQVARRIFDVTGLFPIQRFVIANTLDGADQIVVLPTGSGKSLCYQVLLSLLSGPTMVIVPLLALLRDQIRRLAERGVAAGMLTGAQGRSERNAILAQLRVGSIRAIFTTPEFLTGRWAQAHLGDLGWSHVVVDEAHCIAEWGDTFRPAYRELARTISALGNPLITAFTATASPRVLRRIRETLFPDRSPRQVVDSADRPNIRYSVVPSLCRSRDILRAARQVSGPTVVFLRTRGSVEREARLARTRLADRGVGFYHAGLTRTERSAAEDWFLGSPSGVLFATSAYGMGVDKPDIRQIIHGEPPLSIEAYLQESGRAGRDGQAARAILLWRPQDRTPPSGLVNGPVAQERYRAMVGYTTTRSCRRAYLLGCLGQTAPVCHGCDGCVGSLAEPADGSLTIKELVRGAQRRFTIRDISLIMTGLRVPGIARSRGYDRLPAFGALCNWDPEEVADAIGSLIQRSELRSVRLFGGRLAIPRR